MSASKPRKAYKNLLCRALELARLLKEKRNKASLLYCTHFQECFKVENGGVQVLRAQGGGGDRDRHHISGDLLGLFTFNCLEHKCIYTALWIYVHMMESGIPNRESGDITVLCQFLRKLVLTTNVLGQWVSFCQQYLHLFPLVLGKSFQGAVVWLMKSDCLNYLGLRSWSPWKAMSQGHIIENGGVVCQHWDPGVGSQVLTGPLLLWVSFVFAGVADKFPFRIRPS